MVKVGVGSSPQPPLVHTGVLLGGPEADSIAEVHMTVTGSCYLQLLPSVCLVSELVQQILDHAVHLRPVLEHDQVAGGRGVLHPEPITTISIVF